MTVAEFSVIPIVEGSLRRYVQLAVDEVKQSGLTYQVGAMGTTVEGELVEVVAVALSAHRAVREAGAGRVVTSIKIDERDQELTIKGKLDGLV
jgi:uncharacterized protein (TIGR00106 family)